jgi:hypothetical protein
MTLKLMEDKLYLPGDKQSFFSRRFMEEEDLSEVSSAQSHG